MLARDLGEPRQRVDRARADRARRCRPPGTAGSPRRGPPRSCRTSASVSTVRSSRDGHVAQALRAEAEEVGRLLDPGVRLRRGVDGQRRRPCRRPSRARPAPPFARRAARKPTKFAMLPPLTSSPPRLGARPISSAIQRTVWPSISVAIGRELPPADVRVDGRGQQVGERADRRRRRGDVAEEARVAVEERVLEEQRRRLVEQRRGGTARLGQGRGEQRAQGARRLVSGHRPRGERLQESADRVHEAVARLPELVRGHLERRRARAPVGRRHGSPPPGIWATVAAREAWRKLAPRVRAPPPGPTPSS